MHTKELVFGLILLMQACGPLSAWTKGSKQPYSPGLMQWLSESIRDCTATVQGYGSLLMGFLYTYYEDNIQPVTDNCLQYAASVKTYVWEKIQTSIDNYMQAANPMDTKTQPKNFWQ